LLSWFCMNQYICIYLYQASNFEDAFLFLFCIYLNIFFRLLFFLWKWIGRVNRWLNGVNLLWMMMVLYHFLKVSELVFSLHVTGTNNPSIFSIRTKNCPHLFNFWLQMRGQRKIVNRLSNRSRMNFLFYSSLFLYLYQSIWFVGDRIS
jgi:hypothetical protein